ncbi:MAG: peptide chain release factor 2 [Candidatus Xenobia bacterium]
MLNDYQRQIDELAERVHQLRSVFDLPRRREKAASLEQLTGSPGFWDDPQRSRTVMQELNEHKLVLERDHALDGKLEDFKVYLELLAEDPEMDTSDLDRDLAETVKLLDETEMAMLLSGEFDSKNAVVAVHSGAGGIDAQDWAQMLLRMYGRWAERKGFKTSVVDQSMGEEAGIKSATMMVEGPYAYGYLKAEKGVHRLVRLSPFDAAHRRQTSFANVDVMPELDDDIKVEIRPEDLKVDTYRSSGAGGQHVNKTESAIRITHLPSGIIVACQNERSQHSNRATAMKILKAKLYERQQEEQQRMLADVRGEHKDIAFGSQIRSYVLQPYTMVKDLRTGYEISDTDRVLDGDIDPFIQSYLQHQFATSRQQPAL